MQNAQTLIPYLFRTEFSKMVAVISKLFGLQYIEVAEDIVSDTFLVATETWAAKGAPENPAGWLYLVAKNKTLEYLRRHKLFAEKILPELKHASTDVADAMSINFTDEHIRDNQLQMLFAVCNPLIASEAQIALALRILCGFGIDEIAEAFLTNKETINKRLFRAKEKLREEKVKMELPPEKEMVKRLDNVLHIIYLLFNEGYYTTSKNQQLRKDLCIDAMRLCVLLTEYSPTNLPQTNALLALMCFHASRFPAREGVQNEPVLYDKQDETLWDQALIRQGNYFLNLSAQGSKLTSYHLEAAIAQWHCRKEDTREKWTAILQLYNKLLQINYSPAVALNRVYALAKVNGEEIALAEAEKLKLHNNHFYFLLIGELYKDLDAAKAKANFEKAYQLARTETEKSIIRTKMDAL